MLIFVAVVAVFWPAFFAGFIWDDDVMLTENTLIRGPLSNFWFTNQPIDYFPLTYSSLWMEWRLWGMNPMGYHITNVILHALSCIILWRAFVHLRFPAAWLAALLFAVHPVNVESVAWIAERKNVLAMFFYSITAWTFVRFVQSRERRFYIVSLVAFLLSLLAKPAAAPWPLVAFGLAYWSGRGASQTTTRNVREEFKRCCLWSAPFLVTAIALGLVTVAFQYGNAITPDVRTRFQADLLTRVARVGSNVWFYLGKAFVPYPLLFVYPKWNTSHSVLALIPFFLLIALAIVLWKFRRRWTSPCLYAFGYYLLLLTPVVGFLNIYFQRYSYVADHWQYFALPIVGVLIAFYLQRFRLHYFAGIAVVVLFASLTFARCRVFHDSETIWLDTLAKDPKCCLALNQLGVNREQTGQLEDAATYWRHSLELEPNDPQTRVNLGYCLALMGKADEGVAEIRKAIRTAPDFGYAYYDLGIVLEQQGKNDEAIAEFRQAIQHAPLLVPPYVELAKRLWIADKRDEPVTLLRHALDLDPNYTDALINLGALLKETGKPDESLPLLQKAVALEPSSADAHANLGTTLSSLNQTNAAKNHFTVALQFDPSNTLALYGMADCLRMAGQNGDAAKFYRQVLAQNPRHAESHYQLAMLLVANHQKQTAIEHLRQAVRLKPSWIEPVNNLAWFLATNPNASPADRAEAVRFAQRAADLSGGRNPVALDTLGVAWACNEVFGKASDSARLALALASQAGDTNLAIDIQNRIALYKKGAPYLEP